MKFARCIFGCFSFVGLFVDSIVISRDTRDLFSNPFQENCITNEEYCLERKATCLVRNCCTCQCRNSYSTFHSPGVAYYHKNGKAAYRFDAKESCAWNHYAHEGCRFIVKHPSTLSTRFLPLINLNKDGTLQLKTALDDIYQCDQYQLFSKRPFEYKWADFDGGHLFKTAWNKTEEVQLTLEWDDQGPRFNGLLLKLNFSCALVGFAKKAEPCVILKIKGSYDTDARRSVEPTDTSIQSTSSPTTETSQIAETAQTTAVVKSRAEAAASTPRILLTSPKSQDPTGNMKLSTETSGDAVSNKNATSNDTRGDTFWILVYIFMAFAIFEVLCVAMFLLCRRKQRERKDNSKNESAPTTEAPNNYENHGMTVLPENPNSLNPFPENLQLYENDGYRDPRFHPVKCVGTFRNDGDLAVIENGVIVNQEPSEQGSTGKVIRSGSIIVLPKDCVIVHTSGSRKSRRSEQELEGTAKQDKAVDKNDHEQHNSDNNSLYSWESFSTLYRTSTDEDYVSGGNRTGSLYEEPDKMLGPKDHRRPPLPPKTFGLTRLFALQETAISAKEGEEDDDDDDDDDSEHIYETAENLRSEDDLISSYYENAYDLPEDAVFTDYHNKQNIGSLRHVLDDESSEDDEIRKSSLNLGSEFVNNTGSDGDSDVTLRPKRQSTMYLGELSDDMETRTSVC